MYDSSAALDAMASLPPEPVKRDRSAWGAVWRGVAKTGAELFSQVERAGQIEGMPSRRAADDPIEQERQRSRMRRAEGVAAADRFALEMRPDPASASEAERVVFGLSSGLSKAVALMATLGGLPGTAAFGLSEGESTYRDMRRQGVDEGTALKVAGVTGAAGAAGIALPLVGSTVPRTLGLYLAGGPGGFVAQQAATSAILKAANYNEIAKHFDPLDPVGLAVSALVPLPLLVALAVRRNMRAAAAPEAVDAAMVHNLSTLADQQAAMQAAGEPGAPVRVLPPRPMPADAPQYVNDAAHVMAMRQYFEANGVKVNDDNTVTLWHATTPEAKESITSSGEFRGGATAVGGMTGADVGPSAFFGASRDWVVETWGKGLADPIEVRVPVQYLRHGAQNFLEFYFEGGLRQHPDGTWAPARLQSTFVDRLANKRYGRQTPSTTADFGTLTQVAQTARQAFDAMTASRQTLDSFLASRADLDDGARNVLIGMQEVAGDPRRADALTRALVREGQQAGKTAPDATADAVESVRALTDEQLRGQPSTAQVGADQAVAEVVRRAQEIEQLQPAMPVRTDEAGRMWTAADEMAEARRLAAEGTDVELGTLDADLVRVAAECALTIGA